MNIDGICVVDYLLFIAVCGGRQSVWISLNNSSPAECLAFGARRKLKEPIEWSVLILVCANFQSFGLTEKVEQ